MHLILVDYLCWGATGAVWVLGAIYNQIKAPHTERVSPRWFGMVGAVIVLWVLVLVAPGRIWPRLAYRAEWLSILGAVILGISTVFAIWARIVLGRMWSGTPLVKEGHDLKTTGPYAVTRHPIYTGLLGMVLGVTLQYGFGKATPVLVAVLIFLEVKIRLEERLMTERFGEQYAAYKHTVPQLVPGTRWLARRLPPRETRRK